MFGLFRAVTELAVDTVRVVAAPVQAVVEIADAVVKPVADVAEEFVKDIKDSVK